MIKIQTLDANGRPHYDVDNVENFNHFLDWLYDLGDDDCSISFNGNLHRFRTREERLQFVFGCQAAWVFIDDDYLKKSNGDI